jgi:uncharacterized protein YggE
MLFPAKKLAEMDLFKPIYQAFQKLPSTAFFNTFLRYDSLGITMKRLATLMGLMLLFALAVSAEGQGTQGITVPGEGTTTVPADIAIISVGVQSNNANATLAAAENAERLNKTINALTTAGVQREEIMPGQSSGIMSSHIESNVCKKVNNSTVCENVSNASNLLTSSILIRLKTTDQSRIDNVLQTAKSQGATASIEGYSISDSAPAVTEARKKAIENARANAEDMASAAGVKLGKPIDIMDYGYPDISMNEPFGSSVTSHGTVSVTAYVMVTYEIL